MKNSDDLQRIGLGTVDDHVIGKLRDRPEPDRKYRDVLPFRPELKTINNKYSVEDTMARNLKNLQMKISPASY